MSAKQWSEWRWAFSFHGVENWLLLRMMCGAKRLNPFFRLYEASDVLNKCVMWVWSDNFTGAFFVSFSVTVFVPDIEGIQSKVICLWIGTTTCSVNVTSTCSVNLYDVVANFPERTPILKSLGPPKMKIRLCLQGKSYCWMTRHFLKKTFILRDVSPWSKLVFHFHSKSGSSQNKKTFPALKKLTIGSLLITRASFFSKVNFLVVSLNDVIFCKNSG